MPSRTLVASLLGGRLRGALDPSAPVMNARKKVSTARRQISPHTRQLVLLEAGYMCANPACRHVLTLELHHIVWVRDAGTNEASNLIALCANCHALHTRGHIPAGAIRVWKGVLISLNSVNRSNVDLLLHLYRMEHDSLGKVIRYSGDALLQLAGLFNSGLAETGSAQASSGGMVFPPYSSFEVKLTPRGSALVEAWLQGDEQRYLFALKALGTGGSGNETNRGLTHKD